jgi:hypothetical protein
MILGDVVAWHRLHLAAKPSNVGVNVDGLSCPLHYPTGGQSFLPGAALSHRAAVGGGAIRGGRGVRSLRD